MPILPDRIAPGSSGDIVLDCVKEDGTFQDLDAIPKVTIRDPNKTAKVSNAVMGQETRGRYIYNYQSSTTDVVGVYEAEITGIIEGRTEIVLFYFKVGRQ